MEDKYVLYDKTIVTTILNFLVEDNRNYGVAFSPFDFNNIDHLYAFEVALIFSQSYHKTFYIDMKKFDYLKFKFHNWSVRKSFKRYNKNIQIIPLDLNIILDYMKQELSLKDDIYKNIYNEFYKLGNKNRTILKSFIKIRRKQIENNYN